VSGVGCSDWIGDWEPAPPLPVCGDCGHTVDRPDLGGALHGSWVGGTHPNGEQWARCRPCHAVRYARSAAQSAGGVFVPADEWARVQAVVEAAKAWREGQRWDGDWARLLPRAQANVVLSDDLAAAVDALGPAGE